MLARQVAPLPREFCKDGACFISTNQRGHAFTILRSLKVILNFHTHGARLIRACSQASSTSTTSPISQSGDVTAAAIAGVTLRCDEIVIQIQGCLSHRALAAETNGGCIFGGVGLILDCVAGHKIDHALRPLVPVARTFGILL